jgi:hypothetical protein
MLPFVGHGDRDFLDVRLDLLEAEVAYDPLSRTRPSGSHETVLAESVSLGVGKPARESEESPTSALVREFEIEPAQLRSIGRSNSTNLHVSTGRGG